MQPIDPNSESSRNPQGESAFSRVSTVNRANNDIAPLTTQTIPRYRATPVLILGPASTCLSLQKIYSQQPTELQTQETSLPKKRNRSEEISSYSRPANDEQIENFKKHLSRLLPAIYVQDITTRLHIYSDFATDENARKIENLLTTGIYNGTEHIRFEPDQIRKAIEQSDKRASMTIDFISNPNHIKLLTKIYKFNNQNIADLIHLSTGSLGQFTDVIYDPHIQYQYNRIIKCGFTPRNVTEILRKTFNKLPDTLKLLTDEETVVKLEELTKPFSRGGLGVSPSTLSKGGFLDSSSLKVKERVNGFHKVYKDFFSRHSSKINSENHPEITRLIENYLYKNPRLIAKIQRDNTPIDHELIDLSLDSLFADYQTGQFQGKTSTHLGAIRSSATAYKEADLKNNSIRTSPPSQAQNPRTSLASPDHFSNHIREL
jgi:hypothetical protein